jgi:hypothetical protein
VSNDIQIDLAARHDLADNRNLDAGIRRGLQSEYAVPLDMDPDDSECTWRNDGLIIFSF